MCKNQGMKRLTNQEHRIAKMIARGSTRQAIEKALALNPNTLRVHISSLCKKMELNSPNAFKVKLLLRDYSHERGESSRPVTLTSAEREVIEMRIKGKPFWKIAEIRGATLSTCLNISSHACRKLRIRQSTQPAKLAQALATFDAHPSSPATLDPMNDPAFS